MSTIFCLLIPISSLRGPFISSGRPLKGRSSLPPLISSQPHRSQAFPTQCSLYSHKDPRNPAACPQLIFPVAILLTQPPTGRGCKWRARNRPLCVLTTNPTPPHPTIATTAASFSLQRSGRSVNHRGGGSLTHRPLSASRAFPTRPPLPSTHLPIKQSNPSQPSPQCHSSPLSSLPSSVSISLICPSL